MLITHGSSKWSCVKLIPTGIKSETQGHAFMVLSNVLNVHTYVRSCAEIERYIRIRKISWTIIIMSAHLPWSSGYGWYHCFVKGQYHKSYNAPVAYRTIYNWEQNFAHLCFELCIMGHETGVFWDWWDCSIKMRCNGTCMWYMAPLWHS